MKKLIITTCLTAAALSTAVCFTVTSQDNLKNLSALEMANIEAITKSEGPNTANGYFLTECYSASNPNVITGMTCKQRNYWDSCSYSMAKGDCDD